MCDGLEVSRPLYVRAGDDSEGIKLLSVSADDGLDCVELLYVDASCDLEGIVPLYGCTGDASAGVGVKLGNVCVGDVSEGFGAKLCAADGSERLGTRLLGVSASDGLDERLGAKLVDVSTADFPGEVGVKSENACFDDDLEGFGARLLDVSAFDGAEERLGANFVEVRAAIISEGARRLVVVWVNDGLEGLGAKVSSMSAADGPEIRLSCSSAGGACFSDAAATSDWLSCKEENGSQAGTSIGLTSCFALYFGNSTGIDRPCSCGDEGFKSSTFRLSFEVGEFSVV